MIRLWFKDHSYMDVPDDAAWEYQSDPEYDRSEELEDASGDDDEG